MTAVTAFAPASVSNVGCGFDILGFALEAPGDEVTARFGPSGVRIDDIVGDDGRLPRAAGRNTASVAVQALLTRLGDPRGLTLSIRKGLPLASGLGGSAASAAAAVVAADALLGARSSRDTLVACALDGERLGAGSTHADNIAPCIYGGLVLVRQANPPDVLPLPIPSGLTAVVVHPDLEIETARARALLGDTMPIRDAVRQAANLGALVDALHRSDFEVIARSVEDLIAEPRRAALIPGLADIKRAALGAGALACGISGSGPSLFALCRSVASGHAVESAMREAVTRHIGGTPHCWVSAIGAPGARVVSTCDT